MESAYREYGEHDVHFRVCDVMANGVEYTAGDTEDFRCTYSLYGTEPEAGKWQVNVSGDFEDHQSFCAPTLEQVEGKVMEWMVEQLNDKASLVPCLGEDDDFCLPDLAFKECVALHR